MNLKAKIFSLIVCGLLVIPVLFNTPSNSNILGIQDTRDFQDNKNTKVAEVETETIKKNKVVTPEVKIETPKLPENKIKPNIELPKFDFNLPNMFSSKKTTPKPKVQSDFAVKDISSGVRSNNEDLPNKLKNSNSEVRGEIKWEGSNSTTIITNKFDLGSAVTAKTSDKQTNLVVSQTRALPINVAMIVDQNTFISLGGNPETQDTIYGVVQLNQ